MYNLVIDGAVGVGKTTILNELTKKYDEAIRYYEFLDYCEEGERLLEMRFNDKISLLTLQSFIIDCWEQQFIENDFENYEGMNLMERTPDDAFNDFVKPQLNSDTLEYKLLEKLHSELPYVEIDEITILENENIQKTIDEILRLVEFDYKNNVKGRKIILTCNNIEQRRKERGRYYDVII